ncbi:hypothetical protein L7F22_015105 [Adiantum nelumboides]|nr:hypothetical protein [Adiantum nelumboides]
MAPKRSTKSGTRSVSAPARRNTRSSNTTPDLPPSTQTKSQEIDVPLNDAQAPKIRVPASLTASKGASEVASNHSKDKHDLHDTRHEKRSHKRKRDEASKRKHKDRHKESHRSFKLSSKGEPREKVRRRKDGECSETDSSNSFLSGQHGSNSRFCGADVHQKRGRSSDTAPHKEGYKEHRSKRVKSCKETFSFDDSRENCVTLNQPLGTEEVVHKHKNHDLGKEGHYMGAVSSSKLTRSDRDENFLKGQGREMGSAGRKDKVLEVELRQKALENFLRHQDGSWKTDLYGPLSDVDTMQLATYDEQDGQILGEVGNRCERAVGNAINIDRPKEAHCLPCTSNTVMPLGGNCLAVENDNNLEEGEIQSDEETEHENASFTRARVLHEHVDGKPHAIKDDCEKQDDSRIFSGREIERAGVSSAVSCLKLKQEPSQEQAVKDSPGVDLASAQHDGSDNFQEKTMSVMRGGELVQVSYKVYIPKRAAELARRRLQR